MANPNPLSGTDWDRLLEKQFTQSDWAKLMARIDAARLRGPVYPPASQVFRALELTWCEDTKVVILGQDPYAARGQAEGLCFSVPSAVDPPKSLGKIHEELCTDVGVPTPTHGSLLPWAHRGVLLLNTTLTVREGVSGSHEGMGWKEFTDAVIRVVAERHPVFLLWGAKAQDKEALITPITGTARRIIKSSHPAPPACYGPCRESPPFVDSGPFSKANDLLGGDGIEWDLSP